MNEKYKEIKISYLSVEDFYNDIVIRTAIKDFCNHIEIETDDFFVLKPQAIKLLTLFILQNENKSLNYEVKGNVFPISYYPIFGFKTNKYSKKEMLNEFFLNIKKTNNLEGKFDVEDLETAIKNGFLPVKD